MFVAVFAIILTLILVIGIHEAGHALAASLFKIKIKRIAIGFGRPIIQWRSSSGCEWVLGMWFLGGYVQLNNTRISPVPPEEYDTCFDKKPIGQRVLLLLAGVAANITTAWLVFILVFYVGMPHKEPLIKAIESHSEASRAGLVPQDQIISIGGNSVSSWHEMGQELVIFWGSKSVPVTLKNVDGQTSERVLDLSQIQWSKPHRSLLTALGIVPNLDVPLQRMQAPSLGAAVTEAHKAIGHLLYFFTMVLKQLASGIIPFSVLLGPVGLFAASIASLTQGLVIFLYFIAHLSVAVAFINVLPIPGLDGGSIVYALIEKIRGRPISVALEILIYRLMLVLVFVILVQLLKNDVTYFFIKKVSS